MTGWKPRAIYKSDSSRISKVEPRIVFVLTFSRSFIFLGGNGMSVRIRGLNLLDSNLYQRMIIREDLSGNFQVSVIGEKPRVPMIPTSFLFSDDLKRKKDTEKINLLIEHFLRYSRVSKLERNAYLDYYRGDFQVIKGDRELDFQLRNPELKNSIKMIENKYLNDRLAFCEENKDVSNILLRSNWDVYYQKGNDYRDDYLKFYLQENRGALVGREQRFLQEFLYHRFCEIGEFVLLRDRSYLHNLPDGTLITYGASYVCGNLNLWTMSEPVTSCVEEVVEKYNEELTTQKKLQLKMEGF